VRTWAPWASPLGPAAFQVYLADHSVKTTVQALSENMGTMGLALGPCSLPGIPSRSFYDNRSIVVVVKHVLNRLVIGSYTVQYTKEINGLSSSTFH
jgi:hypothetical protein